MKGGRTLSRSRGRGRSAPRVRSRAALQGSPRFSAPLHPLLQLQQTIGNQAVARLIQAKLKSSQPSDKSEEEADRMADTVMRMPEPPKTEDAEEKLQRQPMEEDEELLQGKFVSTETPTHPGGVGQGENRNGLSRPLRAGLEYLSGMDLSGVRVHHNSDKPAQVNALAYTQEQDIHVGPGQEKHLPHEGWHAVQQMQGRVQPTIQAKGVSINDDKELEQEADVMGAKALQMQRAGHATMGSTRHGSMVLPWQGETKSEPEVPGEATGASGEKGSSDLLSRMKALMERVSGSPLRLRRIFAANPALALSVQAFVQSADDDADARRLNQLMATAFPGATHAKRQEKNPTDPTVKLPVSRKGDKKLRKGRMKWEMKAQNHSRAGVEIKFAADKTKVDAENISFAQTVLNKLGADRIYAGAPMPRGDKATYQPYEEATEHRRIDHIAPSEDDPFYGAEWDASAKTWKQETASWKIGSTKGATATPATMTDFPDEPVARTGLGDTVKEFETVPMVLETAEPLGALKWGWKAKDEENAPIELIGGKDADCTDTPSASHGKALEKFYEAKFDAILDNFNIDKAELKPHHKPLLDTVATKMKGDASYKAQIGGAADLTGRAEYNKKLGLKRAEAAKVYLVKAGVAAGRITTVTYGFDWARVKTAKGKSEGENRRVQVLVRK